MDRITREIRRLKEFLEDYDTDVSEVVDLTDFPFHSDAVRPLTPHPRF